MPALLIVWLSQGTNTSAEPHKGVRLVGLSQMGCGALNYKGILTSPKLPASVMSTSWKRDEKRYFFKAIKAEGGNTRSNMSCVYLFFLWNFLKNCQVPDETSQTIIFCNIKICKCEMSFHISHFLTDKSINIETNYYSTE